MNTKGYKSIVLILVLGLALSVPAGAATPAHSILQLREQVKDGWQEALQVNGRTITISLDIDVPQVDRAPVLRIRAGHDAITPKGQPGELLYTLVSDTLGRNAALYQGAFSLYQNAPEGEYSMAGKALSLKQPKAWKNAFTHSRTLLKPLDWDAAAARNNPTTLKAAAEAVIHHLREASQGQVDLSLNLASVIGISREDLPGQLPPVDLLLGSEYYKLEFTQNLRGLPLLKAVHGDIASDGAAQLPGWPQQPWPSIGAQAKIANEASYSMGLIPAKELELIQEDLPLCSLDAVKQAILGLIRSGHLRSVNSLRLGLVAYPHGQEPGTAIAAPAWVVMGDYYSDPAAPDNNWNAFTPEGRAYIGYPGSYFREIVIDAQTARVLVDITNPQDLLAPAFQTWEQAGGRP